MKTPSFFKQQKTPEVVVFAPSNQVSLANITENIGAVIKNLPKFEKMKKAIVRQVISLETMIVDLTKRIQAGINMSFKEFSKSAGKGEKVNIIVSFLAMLELVKRGVIEAKQHDDFDDIHMETKQVGTPNY
jgi:chromatin segregation and condensation protein Rec8/ScpA/Scc1 (kleisin family)